MRGIRTAIIIFFLEPRNQVLSILHCCPIVTLGPHFLTGRGFDHGYVPKPNMEILYRIENSIILTWPKPKFDWFSALGQDGHLLKLSFFGLIVALNNKRFV